MKKFTLVLFVFALVFSFSPLARAIYEVPAGIASSVSIISPNGGGTYYFGTLTFPNALPIKVQINSSKIGTLGTYLVQNQSATSPGNKYLMFSSGGLNPLVNNISSGSVNLITGYPPYTTGNYYLMTEWRSNDGSEYAYDFSDSSFKISARSQDCTPSIQLITPNGGEAHIIGQTLPIKWTTSCFSNPPLIGFDLATGSTGGHANTFLMSSTGLADDGFESAPIPSNVPAKNNYFIRIFAYDPSDNSKYAVDYSDNPFTISSSAENSCLIDSFKAEPSVVVAGGATKLLYSTNQGCRRISIPELNYTSLGVGGYYTINSVMQTTTYTFIASSNEGCTGANYSSTDGQLCKYVKAQTTVKVGQTPMPEILPVPPIFTTSGDKTPRITYWWGKVNQHVDTTTGQWLTDLDGVSGADLDQLAYCKKWYPKTVSLKDFKKETINTWHDRGNLNSYPSTRISIECVQPKNIFVRPLTVGSKGEDVTQLQNILIQKNLLPKDSVTGYFGKLTAEAVKRFQLQNNLEGVSSVGSATRVLLNNIQ